MQEEALDAPLHLEMEQNPSGLEAHPFFPAIYSHVLQDRGCGCRFISFDSGEEETCQYYCLDFAVTCMQDLNSTDLKGLFNRAFHSGVKKVPC